MVRNYERMPGTRTYRNYTDAQLNEAIQKIVDGQLSMKKASERYKIPYGTLNNKYHGKHIKNTGGQPVFTKLEEEAILNSALKCADWGFPLDLLEIRMLAKKYLDGRGRKVDIFSNNLPGKDWALSLLKRHKGLVSQRVSGNIKKARAKVSRETLSTYFENLEKTLSNIPPSNIFNFDETNVSDDPGSKKLVYRRGVKYPENVVNYSKSSTSIMMCGSADGTLLPPYVIYKSEHLYNTWKEGGISGYPCCTKPCCSQGCRFNRTSHGWMDAVTFEDWFSSSFLPHAKRLEGRKVLIGDNLASHFNDRVIAKCEENNISFVCLVPHSTHICQPLDVAFFKPFKVAWRNVLAAYKDRHHNATGIAKEVFPSLLKSAIDKMDAVNAQSKDKPGDQEAGVKRNLINGFYATGTFPLNRWKVLDKIPDLNYNPDQEINDTLGELLREKRYGNNNNNTNIGKRKRQRLNVIPGKSVTTRDSEEDSDNEVEQHVTAESDVEEIVNGSLNEVEYTTPEKDLLKPETFVLVRFCAGRRKSTNFRYVCKILRQFSENEVNVIGLKSTNPEKSKFKLVEKDLSTIFEADIIAVLPNPTKLDEKEYEFPATVDVNEL